ncbi:hypothetical protein BD410DRAFT_793837 [Rickenella mellea]|uniref:F-box domain-containing protein n=1 Tax=Rickenella mellea TaxID=50990 RepID=A0A4Y7PTS1_9AGAM|nr:hypothetical protein BD410DRAFT_793837 [Rickenella mellea]
MNPHFPSEIWRTIFHFATFTVTSLNAKDWAPHWPHSRIRQFSSPPPYYNVTLKTKKALSLVSTHFRDISIEFMFETVQIHHARQARHLADTIQSHSSSPARWIKSIIIFLDKQDDIYVVDATLIQILPHCTNLTAFGWESPTVKYPTLNRTRDKSSELMKSIPLGIKTLEWNRKSSGISFKCLRHHASLCQFRLNEVLADSSVDDAITLPSITHLEVRQLSTCTPIANWNLPSLSHLTIDWTTGNLSGHLWDTLRSVSITDRWASGSDTFQGIIARLPNLESLFYHIDVGTFGGKLEKAWLGVRHHQSLTEIHIYCLAPIILNQQDAPLYTVEELFSRHLHPIMTGSLPLLRNVRILNASVVFDVAGFQEDVRTDGVDFFANLSEQLSTPAVRVGFQM